MPLVLCSRLESELNLPNAVFPTGSRLLRERTIRTGVPVLHPEPPVRSTRLGCARIRVWQPCGSLDDARKVCCMSCKHWYVSFTHLPLRLLFCADTKRRSTTARAALNLDPSLWRVMNRKGRAHMGWDSFRRPTRASLACWSSRRHRTNGRRGRKGTVRRLSSKVRLVETIECVSAQVSSGWTM